MNNGIDSSQDSHIGIMFLTEKLAGYAKGSATKPNQFIWRRIDFVEEILQLVGFVGIHCQVSEDLAVKGFNLLVHGAVAF